MITLEMLMSEDHLNRAKTLFPSLEYASIEMLRKLVFEMQQMELSEHMQLKYEYAYSLLTVRIGTKKR